MRNLTVLIAGLFLFLSATETNGQAAQDCAIKYNLFKGDVQSAKYDKAYINWVHLMDKCPDLSINIYKLGDKLVEARFETASDKTKAFEDVKRNYEQRLKYYPNVDAAKVHSDYAVFLIDNKMATEEEVFMILEKAYKIDPTRMSVTNIFRYFQGVTDKNKDDNPQLVFDTYDDVLKSVGNKLANYNEKLNPLLEKEEAGTIDAKEKRLLHAYTVNSRALGQIEGGLDAIIIELSTCERLIPLFTKALETNRDNVDWLKSAVSRLYNKECTEDPFYDTIVEAYVKASPSPEASVFYAGILYKKGKVTEAMDYYKQAVTQETDNLKKASYLFKIAQFFEKRGQKSQARSNAYLALQNNPNLGNAYLLIARLYASSANSCGNDEFEKKMVYVAALNKAYRAKTVDPSISSRADSYIKSYNGSKPDSKVIFTANKTPGSSYRVGCWIGETVTIPK